MSSYWVGEILTPGVAAMLIERYVGAPKEGV
jgi:hypothetical protein